MGIAWRWPAAAIAAAVYFAHAVTHSPPVQTHASQMHSPSSQQGQPGSQAPQGQPTAAEAKAAAAAAVEGQHAAEAVNSVALVHSVAFVHSVALVHSVAFVHSVDFEQDSPAVAVNVLAVPQQAHASQPQSPLSAQPHSQGQPVQSQVADTAAVPLDDNAAEAVKPTTTKPTNNKPRIANRDMEGIPQVTKNTWIQSDSDQERPVRTIK